MLKHVWFSNGDLKTGQKMSALGTTMFGERSASEHDQTIWKPDKKVSKKLNVQISGVQYSDGYCTAEIWKLDHLKTGYIPKQDCI